MDVFVAGGTGTLGRPLVRELVRAGHEVTALTRHPENRAMLEALGARIAVADALDAPDLERAVTLAQPTQVVHLLTALPKNGPTRVRDLVPTNRLRVDGTRNLLRAALAAGAKRIVVESFAFVYGLGDHGTRPLSEDEQLEPKGQLGGALAAVDALQSLERQILQASHRGAIEGVVLRYGLLYGPANPSTRYMFELVRRRRMPIVHGDRGLLPFVHVDDAVRATVSALGSRRRSGVYNIVDDEAVSFTEMALAIADASNSPRPRRIPEWILRLAAPFTAEMVNTRLPVSNRRARVELGWQPQFPTIREGLRQVAQQLALGGGREEPGPP
jgi:nucleoside-diphosphate-sugar epimerase